MEAAVTKIGIQTWMRSTSRAPTGYRVDSKSTEMSIITTNIIHIGINTSTRSNIIANHNKYTEAG